MKPDGDTLQADTAYRTAIAGPHVEARRTKPHPGLYRPRAARSAHARRTGLLPPLALVFGLPRGLSAVDLDAALATACARQARGFAALEAIASLASSIASAL
jgi:hypothetical protein